ncbi:hypothetical protein FOZ63_017112, partial [Perkinsus olseni]
MCTAYATRVNSEDALKTKRWKGIIVTNIIFIQMAMSVSADALKMDDTVANPMQDPELRSLRLPVVNEKPPGCLPPGAGFQGLLR